MTPINHPLWLPLRESPNMRKVVLYLSHQQKSQFQQNERTGCYQIRLLQIGPSLSLQCRKAASQVCPGVQLDCVSVAFCSPAKSLTFGSLTENPFVGKKLKSQHPSNMHQRCVTLPKKSWYKGKVGEKGHYWGTTRIRVPTCFCLF